jgi:hypothetical protein
LPWQVEALGSVQSVSLVHSTQVLSGAVSVDSPVVVVLHSDPRGLPRH